MKKGAAGFRLDVPQFLFETEDVTQNEEGLSVGIE